MEMERPSPSYIIDVRESTNLAESKTQLVAYRAALLTESQRR